MSAYTFEWIEDGLIENVYYESHKRGRNWVSKISGKNSVEFDRENVRCSGKKVSASDLKVGDALEMGGDYISSCGNRTPNRGYHLITSIDDKGVHTDEYTSIAKMLKAKNAIGKEVAA